MAILEGNSIWIKRARLSFPALLQPKAPAQGADPKYSADFILDADAPEWVEVMKMIQTMAAEKWGEQASNILNMINQDSRQRCYGQGSEKVKKSGDGIGQLYEGYEGKLYIGGSSANAPQLIGTDAQPLPPTANKNELFNGGNYVGAILNIWLQDNQFGKGVRAGLTAVQFLEKGESFGVVPIDATSVFTQVAGAPGAAAAAEGGGMPGMGNMPGMGGEVDPLA